MKSKTLAILPLLALLGLVFSCNNSVSSSSSDIESYDPILPDDETSDTQTYTITFLSKGQTIYQVSDAKTGDYIDIPVLPADDDPRIVCSGWVGMSDDEFQSGKVRVYQSDMTYQAIWKERFGTEQEFEATRIKAGNYIVVDGIKDDAYADAMPIAINQVSSGDTNVSATAYVMWDSHNIYALFEVVDSTYQPYEADAFVNSVDSMEFYLDLLHNDSLCEFDYVDGWGGVYRGDVGPMCEGLFRIASGVSYNSNNRYGAGSDFMFEGWLSNAAKESGNTVGTTYRTANGYNVEYLIDCTNAYVPEELRPHEGAEIGIGINIFDSKSSSDPRNKKAANAVSLESINIEMNSGPKKLSNFKLVKNDNDEKNIIEVVEARSGYSISQELSTKELAFKDAPEIIIGDSAIQLLWDGQGLYAYATLGNGTKSICLESDLSSMPITLTESSKAIFSSDALSVNSVTALSITITDQLDISDTIEFMLECISNVNNVNPERKQFTAKHLASEESITIDGEKDAGYELCQEIDISYRSLIENDSLNATGKAYAKWDESYLYLFVDVTDDDVDATTLSNEPWLNDSMELWLSTCRTLPSLSTGWGDANRPYPSYCGEGGFRVRAGSSDISGMHWMFDDGSVTKNVASKVTDHGYTVEYQIGWASYQNEIQVNDIIDMTLNINDGEANVRKGITSTNAMGHETYLKPGYLDHLMLVA